jgi:hypothetical protein
MPDATILIPTYRHAELLPFAVRSALAQVGSSFEVFVVGDGVEDDTRAALDPYLSDERVRFFDRPKGGRNGELLRHEALQQASGDIVCYLSDDDLLLPWCVGTMRELLVRADMAQDLPVNVSPDGVLRYHGFNLGRPEFVELMAAGLGGGGLTGAAHTRGFYERLPFGWRPAPASTPSDMYMFRQLASMPGFKGVTSDHLTALRFPSSTRRGMSLEQRVQELARWERRLGDPGLRAELDHLTALAARAAAERLKLVVVERERELERIRKTRWWRLRVWSADSPPGRAYRRRRG